MSETLLSKLEASRKELLDLGLRNPLLNYKLLSGKGLQIVQERSSLIYDILVKQSKAMSFLGRPDKNENQLEFVELSGEEAEEAYRDTKLQTNETELKLQSKLLNTFYAARTSIEEQGVNILYVALGMLHWYESGTSEEERRAPLVLVPVTLERSSARERFRVRYSLEEIGANSSLQAKMKAEFGITIPDLPETEDFDIVAYFDGIATAIAKDSRWRVEQDAIELGFFSFGKFMIYNDLDSSKWPMGSKPSEHTIIQSLFEGGFRDPLPTVPTDANIDRDTNAHRLHQILDADSSQVLAMLAIQEGRNLVIQGPPGTGKSQTITNIIANAIGEGKKVLFVAEKMAALEVVKRRLDNNGLGESCLELHSHKANKKELHQELRRVLELGKPAIQQLEQEIALLDNYKDELNAYCEATNTEIGQSGLTAHKVIGYLLELYDQTNGITLPKIPLPEIQDWDAEKMKRAEAFAERVQARLIDIGVPGTLLFWGSQLKILMPTEQEELILLLKEAKRSTENIQTGSSKIASELGFTNPLLSRQDIFAVVPVLELAAAAPDLKDLDAADPNWLLNQADIEEVLEAGAALAALYAQYQDILISEAWTQQVIEIRQDLLAHGEKWYKFLIGSYKNSNRKLAGLCKTTLPKDNVDKIQYVDDIIEARRLESLLQEHGPLAAGIFGSNWKKLKSDWNKLRLAAGYLADVHQKIANGECPKAFPDYLNRTHDPAIAKRNLQTIREGLGEHEKSIQRIIEKIALDQSVRFPEKKLPEQPFSEQTALLDKWISRIAEIHQMILWNNLTETAHSEKLECLIDSSIRWEHASQYLKLALQKTWYEYLLEKAMIAHPALRKFERTSHEVVVSQFIRLDKLNQQYHRARVALRHWTGLPRFEAGGQVNVLGREFNKKARHMPIRKLMVEAGLAIQAIKPVFMMSPLSIANFLGPGVLEFDLVIFDEASQVKPVDALGAILRGRQVVVVGDTKQLPPTSFFDSLIKDSVDEDEENVTADLPSILGMCDAQGAPQRMLRWHYRSRHESLITVSNHEFYEDKLVIFPSPGSKTRMGLVYHELKNTAYDRGKTRTNPKEAEAVADAVIGHAQKYPKLSLGVVAFSSTQRQAIQDALELKRRKNPDVEVFFKTHPHEPFFVKNLENVQGDERDVIFISIGYGRTEEGYLSMSFGPLNNEGGERRLNVLITRAKLRCEIFTNLTSDDIDLSKTQKFGIRALKTFLYFAQHGKLHIAEEDTGLPVGSPFEENVVGHLTKLGYIVRTQVGSQGFYIDLAIVDPENPGRYLLGIECDGAPYYAAQSARDRDRLRQEILENIGWKLHRIWSTDWFRNPERELKRVVEAIEKAKLTINLDDETYDPSLPSRLMNWQSYRRD